VIPVCHFAGLIPYGKKLENIKGLKEDIIQSEIK
jgi:hypothetical protein